MIFKGENGILTKDGKVLSYSAPPSITYDLLLTSEESNFTKDGSNLISQWDDTSGNGNNVTQGNSTYQPEWQSSVDGSPAVYFTNRKGLETSTSFDFNVPNFTIEFWFKGTNTIGEFIRTCTTWVLGTDGFSIAGIGYLVFRTHTTNNMWYLPGGTYNSTIFSGNWVHIAVQRREGADNVEFYLNGVKATHSTLNNPDFTQVPSNTIKIGSSSNSTIGSYNIDCHMDDIKINLSECMYPVEGFTPTPRS